MKNNLFMLTLLTSCFNLANANDCGFENILTQSVYESLFPAKITPYNYVKGKEVLQSSSVQDVSSVDFTKYVINLRIAPWDPTATPGPGLLSDFNSKRSKCEEQNASCKGYFDYTNIKTAFNDLNKLEPDVYSQFGCSGSGKNDHIREIAGFLANGAQETNGGTPPTETSLADVEAKAKVGLSWGFSKIREDAIKDYDKETEIAASNNLYNFYCKNTYYTSKEGTGLCYTGNTTKFCDHVKDFCLTYNYNKASQSANGEEMWYYGRGPKQLSYFSNYLVYGGYIMPSTPLTLATNPNLLVTNPVIGWKTAFAFWNKPYIQQTSTAYGITTTKMNSMHDVMFSDSFAKIESGSLHGGYGFGQTINRPLS